MQFPLKRDSCGWPGRSRGLSTREGLATRALYGGVAQLVRARDC